MWSKGNYMYMFILCFLQHFLMASCQEWTWLNGQDTADVESTKDGPGSRSGSSSWRDLNGDVWLFGGKGFSDLGKGAPSLLNDLWKYNIKKNQWSLVHPGTVSMTGSTHSLSSNSPLPYNLPQPRHLSSGCGVTNVTFVVFGGSGENDTPLGDTWIYFIEKQTWLSLNENMRSSLDNLSRIYENVTESPLNDRSSPRPRSDMVSWCMYDTLLIYSGKDKELTLLNNMWELSLRTLDWKEIRNITIDDSLNAGKDTHKFLPRVGAVTWVDKMQSLYMFGGNTFISGNSQHTFIGYLSDLWHFNITCLTWKLLAGTTQPHKHGVYGKMFSLSNKTIPGSRQGSATWVDSEDNLWLFGGDGMDKYSGGAFQESKLLSDIWRFKVDKQIWTWMGGSDTGEAVVKYTPKGETSKKALVGGRCRSSVWTGSRNQLYIFGGIGHDSHQHDGYLNDVWLLDVDMLVIPSYYGISLGTIVFFTLLILTVILVTAVISLCAKDKNGISAYNRFDHNIKYSHLSTTGD